MKRKVVDVVIVGTGVAGLYTALNIDRRYEILMITKEGKLDCNSYLAQGGMSVLRDSKDFEDYREDTLKAGHYKNKISSVETMIKNSREVLEDLLEIGVRFERDRNNEISYTREGGHSRRRIAHYKDETGKEIVEKLMEEVEGRENITILENTEMVDIIVEDERCKGIVTRDGRNIRAVLANWTILATGGIGGLFNNSTNFSHIKGDGIALIVNYGGIIKNMDYIQYHPTTLYEEREGRKYLLTEALRGEGAHLLNRNGERFINELLPRDIVTNAILKEMEREGSSHVYLSMAHLEPEKVRKRFPYIWELCEAKGLDLCSDKIPIVPGQHYHMGGIDVDENSMTSIRNLFAVGECSCNGVHGQNRLASNSLLESMVFGGIVGEYINRDGEYLKNFEDISLPEKNWDRYVFESRNRLRRQVEINYGKI